MRKLTPKRIIEVVEKPINVAIPNPNKFTEVLFRSEDVGAHQGVAKNDDYFYTSAGEGGGTVGKQYYVMQWDLEWNLIKTIDCRYDAKGIGDGYIGQINGLFYDKEKDVLLVSAWAREELESQSYAMEYNPTTLEHIQSFDTKKTKSEAFCKYNGFYWLVGGAYHSIFRFDLDWNYVGKYDLTDDGYGRHWQAIFVIDDVFFLNHHAGKGVGSEYPFRAYAFNGLGFENVSNDVKLPSYYTTQGAYYDGEYIWWAERYGNTPNKVIQTSVK